MNNGKAPIKVSHDFELVSPVGQRGFGMPESEWRFLRRKINNMKSPDNLFLLIGFTLFGISGSNIFLVLFTEIQKTIKVHLWVSFLSALIIGGLCLLFHFLRGKEVTHSKEDILDDMDRIEKTYGKLD